MEIIRLLKKAIKSPRKIPMYFIYRNSSLARIMSDEKYLKLAYWSFFGTKLDLANPVTYNQKLQWLKLYDRNPLYTKLVDKYEVREYIRNKIGDEYLIPLLGMWESFDEIDFRALPNQFVLKCTHDSGGLVICVDKSKLNIKAAKKKIEKCLKTNFFWYGREWPYKNVKPRIIAEQYMVDESGIELKDYKLFCFHGVPQALFVATDRETNTRFDFFDMNFNHLPLKNGHENAEKKINKPAGFAQMKKLAETLSAGIPQVRVDFYDINGKVYFGEMTFFHWSGFVPFEPGEWDKVFGDWIKLQKNNNI